MDVREKLGLREGGFGLLITGGMVDEMKYNDVGNRVTLIKRFRRPAPEAIQVPSGLAARQRTLRVGEWPR